MKEKQRKIMGLIISFVMIITIMPQTIWASDAGSREDAVKWAYAQEGKFLDYDKVYGAQCVDLVHYYYAYFGKASYATGNGCDFVNNKLPDGWTRIKNTPDFVPQPGDIAVWGKELSQYGHVAIILSADAHSFVSMDQNWPRGSACKKVTHNYNTFWGVIRPNFSEPPSDPVTTTPSIWKNSDSYTVGNSATLTWNSVDNATGYWFSVWYKGEQIVTTQVSGSSEYTLNNLGEGEYTAFITAYNDISSKQGSVTFRVNYLDIGTNFIANIIKVDSWSHVVNDNTNACIGKEVGNANEYYEFTRQSDGAYIIKSLEDGKYLEVSDGGNKNGQNVGFGDYTGENNQRWYIKNGSSGKILIPKNATESCLDISNNGSAVGTNAQIWAQAGVAAQEFSIYTQSNIPNFINFGDDFYANIIKASTWSTLVNKNPNLEVGGEGEAEGSDIWHFRRMKDGTYTIQSLFDGKYLDVEEFSNQKGANVHCYDYTGASNQRWYLTLGKNGKVLIPKNATGLCLDVFNDGSDAGTNAQLWEPNGTTAQEFNVYKEDTIKLDTANVTLSNNNYIYDGKEKKPDVTVKYGYATLQQGTDYTVEYSNNTKAGTATVTIKGFGIYSGTVSKNFEIKEALYTVYGYQVVIDGNFDLKYYIDLSKEAANDTDTYIEFKVGDRIQIWGRVQSREYEKKREDGEPIKKVAYEVSISKIKKMSENNND